MVILAEKKGKSLVKVFDLWNSYLELYEFKKMTDAHAVSYSADGKILFISTGQDILYVDSKKFKTTDTLKISFSATKIRVNPDGNYIAATDGNNLAVWNIEDKSIVKDFNIGIQINDIDFSESDGTLGVLTGDGVLSIYDPSNFLVQLNIQAMGEARSFSFHPDGKYVSAVTGDNRIVIVNMMDDSDRNYIESEVGGINKINFISDEKNRIYLAYNTVGSIEYESMGYLTPNYTKLLSDQLSDRMDEWMQRMPGETLQDYNARTSEENYNKQMMLFEQEIATSMADNLVSMSEISFGNYNTESNMLSLDFDNMPSIYLDVPEEDINDFMDPGKLDFNNVKYGLTKSGKFEMVYAEVYNLESNKSYVFDNRERMSLDFLASDDNFVPLNLVQHSMMEELKLEEIRNDMVDIAKRNNTISDHTNISVKTDVLSDTDANGNKINNYKINFKYEVESGFSVKEDFAPGKYKVEDSGAAKSMLSVIQTALNTEFSSYIKDGKKLHIVITGMADNLPINNKITYDGIYGDIVDIPVYKNDEPDTITVTKETGITKNEQLAFLRAFGVKEYINNSNQQLNCCNL